MFNHPSPNSFSIKDLLCIISNMDHHSRKGKRFSIETASISKPLFYTSNKTTALTYFHLGFAVYDWDLKEYLKKESN